MGHLSKECGKIVEFLKCNLPNITNKIINPKGAWHHKRRGSNSEFTCYKVDVKNKGLIVVLSACTIFSG